MLANRRVARWLVAPAILLVAVVCALAAAWGPWLRPALYARVGEGETLQLLKGAAAYYYLQIFHPAPDLAPYTPMDHVDEPPFGINTFLEQEVEPAKVARSLDMIKAAGFHFVRQEFPWEDIEISAKGDFYDHKWNVSAWDKYDRIVDMAHERGLELIVRLDHPPAWTHAASGGQSSFGPPDNLADYGDFVAAVVSRYKGKVRYYQIWNEPNIEPEWGDQPVDAAGYTRLLQEAYTRAKAVDPDCVIISAGLAPTLEHEQRNYCDLTFLQKMYDAGAKGYFDILGAMAYGLWTGPTDHRLALDRTNFARPQYLRAIMVKNGDADKPIWASEIGWSAVPADFTGPANYGRVTRDQQAEFGVAAYQRAQQEWPWMGTLNYWFFKRAGDSERNQAWYYFGLLEPDFTPWPAYAALSNYANAPATLYRGYHQESDWTLRYSGVWQSVTDASAVLGHYRRGDAGARLSLTVEGAAVDLVSFGPVDPAALRLTVDGKPARVAPVQQDGRTVWPLLRRLTAGRHTLDIEVAQGSLTVDGIIVRSEGPRWPLFALGAGAVVLAVLSVVLVRRRVRGTRG